VEQEKEAGEDEGDEALPDLSSVVLPTHGVQSTAGADNGRGRSDCLLRSLGMPQGLDMLRWVALYRMAEAFAGVHSWSLWL